MTFRFATAAVFCLALSATEWSASDARAQSAATPVLCGEKTLPPGFVPAVLTARSMPTFPEADAAEESEGWVQLGFTIDAQGDTRDIVILDRVGSQAMAREARLAVARSKYKPATENGLAVEQYGNAAELLFRDQKIGNAAIHDAVVARFDEGRVLIGDAKYAAGITVLEQALTLPLTLFERARISFALAFAYEKSNDSARALVHVRHALIEGGAFLEKAVVPSARRLRLRLEVANGNLQFAACAPALPASDKFDPTGSDRAETMRIVDGAMKRLAGGAPLSLEGTLIAEADGGSGGVWEHPLSRPTFKFNAPGASARDFRLTCIRQVTSGAVNETAQWSVPRSAGACTLRVYGAIGARLRLIEEW